MKLIYTLLLGIFCFVLKGSAQDIPVPADLGGHPRILTKGQSGKDSLAGLLAKQNWARQVYDDLKKNIDPYVNRHVTDSTWNIIAIANVLAIKCYRCFCKKRGLCLFLGQGACTHRSVYRNT